MPGLANAGFAVLVPDMRGYGDSDKPAGTEGYDARALAEEFRALVREIGFGAGRPLTLVAHDMGAPPALLWAADHPEEVAGLLYIEVPVMLSEVLTKIIAYTPEAMKEGSMWWWILPLAPDVPERLIVGNERAFLTWFYERHATPEAIDGATVDEYLRTFSGREGVLGALGVYRAAFTTMEQTAPLTKKKVQVPVVALGGEKAQGLQIRKMVEMVAANVDGGSIPDCGHFVPEECPEEILRHVLAMTKKLASH
jgi:pimeloyl-ACP methyl ester carboxylesterase